MSIDTITIDFPEDAPPVSIRPVADHGSLGLHGHEFFEMVFILHGFTLHSCGGSSAILTAGDIFFIPPGISHAYITTHQTWLYNILFLPKALELCGIPPQTRLYREPTRAKAGLALRQDLISAVERILSEFKTRGPAWDRMVMARFSELLVLFERAHEETPHLDSSNAHYRQLMLAMQYIEGNLTRDLLLEELAAASGMSPGSLTRQFKLVTGLSPMEYVRNQRIARAVELLKNPGSSVSGVSAALGFSDISVFSRQFRQITGLSPSEFRRSL